MWFDLCFALICAIKAIKYDVDEIHHQKIFCTRTHIRTTPFTNDYNKIVCNDDNDEVQLASARFLLQFFYTIIMR